MFLRSGAKNISVIYKRAQSFYALSHFHDPKHSFHRKDLVFEPSKNKKQIPEFNMSMKFGALSTDHILEIDFDKTNGWGKPIIKEIAPFQIHPFNTTLHYAIECFEGCKAFKDEQGTIRLFRTDLNMNRFRNSCKKISLPDFNPHELLECIKEFVRVEKDWVPNKPGFSLYIRPTAISMTDILGVRAPEKSKIFVCASPVGPYYPTGFYPIKLWCELDNIRAAPKGCGSFKLGSNYGPTIAVTKRVEDKGYNQILWLYKDIVTEVGTSNVFFFWINEDGEKELITHPADDLILHGVMRHTVLELCRKWGEFKVTERSFKIQEVIKAIIEHRLIEGFSAGTAVTIGPLDLFHYHGYDYKVPLDPKLNAGQLTKRISDHIIGIQYGKTQSDWAIPL